VLVFSRRDLPDVRRTGKADHTCFACILRPAFINQENADIAGRPPRYHIFKAPNKCAGVAYLIW
jgi:hypothetical protein